MKVEISAGIVADEQMLGPARIDGAVGPSYRVSCSSSRKGCILGMLERLGHFMSSEPRSESRQTPVLAGGFPTSSLTAPHLFSVSSTN